MTDDRGQMTDDPKPHTSHLTPARSAREVLRRYAAQDDAAALILIVR